MVIWGESCRDFVSFVSAIGFKQLGLGLWLYFLKSPLFFFQLKYIHTLLLVLWKGLLGYYEQNYVRAAVLCVCGIAVIMIRITYRRWLRA